MTEPNRFFEETNKHASVIDMRPRAVSNVRRGWNVGLGALFVIALVIVYATYRTGSVFRVIPYLAGQRVFVEPKIDFGKVSCGDVVTSTVEIVNRNSRPASVVGSRKSCGCISTEVLPVAIEAGATYSLKMELKVLAKATKFSYTVDLYIADGEVTLPYSLTLSGIATE